MTPFALCLVVLGSVALSTATAAGGIPDPCAGAAAAARYCNTSLSFHERAVAFVATLSTADKISQLQNGAGAIPSSNMPAYQWWSEALHGVANSPGVTFNGEIQYATSFPQIIGMGATFNTTLIAAMGKAISTEARAMNNAGQAGLTFWAPNINIYRDPRWGRGQETPGEDPFVNAAYAANFVYNMQYSSEDPQHLKVSSCCKHYNAYSLENWDGVDRHHFNAIVTPQDMNDTYLVAFQSCVERGQASAIMCSYNAVNGVPSCANHDYITGLLRNTWGFNGYVTSDCGAVADIYYTHHYTATPQEAVAVALKSGMDTDCGSFVPIYANSTLQQGLIAEADIDRAVVDLYEVLFRLGVFDPAASQPYRQYGPDVVNSKAHQQLALEAAQQAVVLLKNDMSRLPLSPGDLAVAVLGPNMNATQTLLGNYYGDPEFIVSPLQGISKYASSVMAAEGCDMATNDTSGFAAATALAAKADVTVLVMGLDQTQESEGNDRTSIALPGVQADFIRKVAGAAKSPVVLVLVCGGPVDVSEFVNDASIGAIVWAGYGGQWGGRAIGDVLFGAYNPAGRLPTTWYQADFVNQVSMFDMNMRPNTTTGYPGRTYRFYTGTPVFAFGAGLSYTNFTTFVHPTAPVMSTAANTVVNVTITNTGSVDGSYVLVLRAVPPHPGWHGAPISFVVGFDRVFLAAGASTTVSLVVNLSDLMLTDETGARQYVAGKWHFQVEHMRTEVLLL